MEHLCIKPKGSESENDTTKTREERRSISISNTGDTSDSSNESICLEKSQSLTLNNTIILSKGDLTRMHLIDTWAAAANIYGELSEESLQFAFSFVEKCCFNSDGALLHALIHLPHFPLMASSFITIIDPTELVDDPLFLATLRDFLLPHVRPEHANDLRWRLRNVIKDQYPVSVREFYDALWSKAVSNESSHVQSIKGIYGESLEKQKKEFTNESWIKSVINTGISRHIRAMLHIINDPSHKDTLDSFSKSKLLEWALCSHLQISEINMLKNIDSDHLKLIKDWIDERKFFTSKISTHRCRLLQMQSSAVDDSIVGRILNQLDTCAYNCRTDEKAKAISWLLSEICKAMEEEDPSDTWEPKLTGSAAECTQALFIDEFDYLLLKKSKSVYYDKDGLNSVMLKMTNMHHPNLALGSIALDNYLRLYPCLHITWVDGHLRNTHICIDMVLAGPLDKSVTLPHHNFLPVPREQRPDDGNATPSKSIQCRKTEKEDHEYMSSLSMKNIPRLFTDIYRNQTVFSEVENALIKALPSHIIEGYRLAKAVRVNHVIRQIIKKLIELGVTVDIHKVIRTYHLKTCVFYLTEHYVCGRSDIEGNIRLKWAIAIYEKLREFVMLGDVKEFFATERYVFRGQQQECKHDEEDFTAPLPRYRCCRRRRARLLMVDEILFALREFKSKNEVKHTTIGKALSMAVNTSVLHLI